MSTQTSSFPSINPCGPFITHQGSRLCNPSWTFLALIFKVWKGAYKDDQHKTWETYNISIGTHKWYGAIKCHFIIAYDMLKFWLIEETLCVIIVVTLEMVVGFLLWLCDNHRFSLLGTYCEVPSLFWFFLRVPFASAVLLQMFREEQYHRRNNLKKCSLFCHCLADTTQCLQRISCMFWGNQ